MSLNIDAARGKRSAQRLFDAFAATGVLGQKEMPEDILPPEIGKGSLEHILFITLTVSIDYQRSADDLWASSRRSYSDPQTRYLFSPEALPDAQPKSVVRDMQKYGLSRKPVKDANIWRTVAVSFYKKWQGDPRNFLADCDWDAPRILERLKQDTHLYNQRQRADFPYLRGNKIGPLWLRMLRDNAGVSGIRNLDRVPIPVDIHVARSTLALGIVQGDYRGKLEDLFETIRQAWFESVKGLDNGSRPMMALDVDEPLWHLSKYGCTHRDKLTGECPKHSQCEAREFCIPGKININNGKVELDT
jgi:hypothetical protein